MFRPFAFCFAIAIASCWNPPQPTPSERVYYVAARDLYRSYLDNSTRWNEFRIQVILPAETYNVRPNKAVLWNAGRDTEPPNILFECHPPADNKRDLEIIGICRGRSVPALAPVRWYVLVTECTVTVR